MEPTSAAGEALSGCLKALVLRLGDPRHPVAQQIGGDERAKIHKAGSIGLATKYHVKSMRWTLKTDLRDHKPFHGYGVRAV